MSTATDSTSDLQAEASTSAGGSDSFTRRLWDYTSRLNTRSRDQEMINERTHLLRAERNLFKSLRGGDSLEPSGLNQQGDEDENR